MKHTHLKRLLAFVLAAVMLMSFAACGSDDNGKTDPTASQPTNSPVTPTQKPATPPSKPSGGDTVKVYAHVPDDWTAYCWAWNNEASAFDTWPGSAMTKQGDWYVIEVPNWIENVIISNKGTPQTNDLPVTKGKDVWVVVKAADDASVYYSEPDLSGGDDTPPIRKRISKLSPSMPMCPLIGQLSAGHGVRRATMLMFGPVRPCPRRATGTRLRYLLGLPAWSSITAVTRRPQT